jgi:hypothetical protein
MDGTDFVNTGAFIAQFFAENMARLPGGIEACAVVCTDSAANCKSAGGILVDRYPWLSWIPCTAHIVDLYLEDVAKIDPFADAIAGGRLIINFVRNHGKSKSLLSKLTPLKLVLFNDTRFATHCLAMDRLLEVRVALQGLVVSQEWVDWLQTPGTTNYREAASVVKAYVLADDFWTTLAMFKDICSPAIKLMREADGAKPGSICKIYQRAADVERGIEMVPNLAAESKAVLQDMWLRRWEQLHSPLHAAAYVLDPEFAFNEADLPDQMAAPEDELKLGLLISLRKVFHNEPEKVATALAQHSAFLRGVGYLGQAEVRDAAKQMPPHIFWEHHGYALPELRVAAMRICAQISSSCVCERTFSNYDYVHNKRRNRLGVARAQKLVKVFGCLRTEQAAKAASFADGGIPWRWEMKNVDEDADDGEDADDDDDEDVNEDGNEAASMA